MIDRLSTSELAELIGCRPNQRSRMIRWLVDRHWKFEIDIHGVPVVMRAYRDRKLGIDEGKASATYADSPNFA